MHSEPKQPKPMIPSRRGEGKHKDSLFQKDRQRDQEGQHDQRTSRRGRAARILRALGRRTRSKSPLRSSGRLSILPGKNRRWKSEELSLITAPDKRVTFGKVEIVDDFQRTVMKLDLYESIQKRKKLRSDYERHQKKLLQRQIERELMSKSRFGR